jgi:Rieske Fe-S protein
LGAALGLGSVGASALAGCGSGRTGSGPSAGGETPSSRSEVEPGRTIAAEGEVEPNSAVAYSNAQTGQPEVLVRLRGGKFVAYSAVCTHQQCAVAYQKGSSKLVCPCHGSVFDPAKEARVLSGPAPRPLPEVEIEVRDGKIYRA